jgi:beta-N-acetylhexosaminidase
MTRAFICGCSASALTEDERRFLREAQPYGLILFKRNVASPAQVRALVDDVQDCLGGDAAILIDQEGGRVQRLGPPHWRAYPAAARYGDLQRPFAETEALVRLVAQVIAADLRQLGINVDCLPVLDVPVPSSHNVIGDRAYGEDPLRVARFGRAAAEGLLAGGVLPVMKHIPGHGRAEVDSHHALPRVTAAFDELLCSDFAPFIECADLPAAMTAHVVYKALDAKRPASISADVIGRHIRGTIGFDGLLMTDDLSMQALEGTLAERAAAAFAAGVDIALHCNGDLGEARQVAEAAPMLEGPALARAQAARRRVAAETMAFDPVDAWAEVEGLLAKAG